MKSPGQQIGKYTIIDRIGVGGMGEVFKCRLAGIGGFEKMVVVKRILPDLVGDPEVVNMFLDEARVAANLTHPNVVQIYEIDEDEGVPYIAMEYVRGPSFSALIRQARQVGKLHFGHAARIVADVAAGLHCAHTATDPDGHPLGIVHRDVTPHNVLVTTEGVAKLVDFGVAKATGRLARTREGAVKGKLRYMAPEQVESSTRPIDRRADLFSLGVCLYHATTGSLPFSGDNEVEVMKRVIAGEFRRPAELMPGYPPDLEAVVLWAMERDPVERCADGHAMQAALESFLVQGPWASSHAGVAGWIKELFPHPDVSHSGMTPLPHGQTPSWGRGRSGGGWSTPGGRASPAPPRAPSAEEFDIVTGTSAVSGPSQEPGARRGKAPLVAGAVAVVAALAVGGYLLTRPGPPPPAPVAAPTPAPGADSAARATQAALAYLDEAESLAKEGKLTTAIELLGRAREAKSDDPKANIRLARLESSVRRTAQVKKCQKALAAGDSSQALSCAMDVLEENPDDADATAVVAAVQAARAEAKRKEAAVRPGARPRAVAMGALNVSSTPAGATVIVDDEILGRTPARLKLPAGRHVLVLRLKDHAPEERPVQLVGGREAQVTVTLAALSAEQKEQRRAVDVKDVDVVARVEPPPADRRDPPRTGVREAPPDKRDVAPAEPPKASPAVLVVQATPAAEVYLDGSKAGRTPLTLSDVAPGAHRVEARLEGHEAQAREVRVEAGQKVDVGFTLPPVAPPPTAAVAATGPKPPRLPKTYQARTLKDIARVCATVEKEAVDMGGAPPGSTRMATAALLNELSGQVNPGQAIEMYPAGMYWLIVKDVAAGKTSQAIGEHLRAAHLGGELPSLGP